MEELKKKDLFENKPIWEAIIRLAIPSIIGQIILVVYNIADTFFIGLTNSEVKITAVSVCMPAFMFMSALANLFGVGGASLISRSVGKGDIDKAKRVSSFAFWGCLFLGILYILFMLLFVDRFVDLLGGKNPDVHELAKNYLFVTVAIGGIPTIMNNLFAHLIRSEGRSFHASFGVAFGGILNVGLDYLFMFVFLEPGNEVLGAAIATALSNTIALLYYIVLIIKDRIKNISILSFVPTKRMYDDGIPEEVITVGIPACLMTLFENISYAILDNLMYGSGLSAQAGIGVAKKINMLAHSIVRGMTQGVLPLIGYNKSSGNRTRMTHIVYMSTSFSVILSLICMTVSLTLSKQLTSIFISANPDALYYGAKFLRILCIGAPFSAIAYSVISFFQATGKSFRSLVLALLRKGIVDIPLMLILNTVFVTYGIVWATPIADLVCSIIALILFFQYIKKHGKTIEDYQNIVKNA